MKYGTCGAKYRGLHENSYVTSSPNLRLVGIGSPQLDPFALDSAELAVSDVEQSSSSTSPE